MKRSTVIPRTPAALRRWKMCDRKASYPNAVAAYQKGQQTYRCPHCRQWHRSGAVASYAAYLRKLKKRLKRRRS